MENYLSRIPQICMVSVVRASHCVLPTECSSVPDGPGVEEGKNIEKFGE